MELKLYFNMWNMTHIPENGIQSTRSFYLPRSHKNPEVDVRKVRTLRDLWSNYLIGYEIRLLRIAT